MPGALQQYSAAIVGLDAAAVFLSPLDLGTIWFLILYAASCYVWNTKGDLCQVWRTLLLKSTRFHKGHRCWRRSDSKFHQICLSLKSFPWVENHAPVQSWANCAVGSHFTQVNIFSLVANSCQRTDFGKVANIDLLANFPWMENIAHMINIDCVQNFPKSDNFWCKKFSISDTFLMNGGCCLSGKRFKIVLVNCHS